MDWIADPQAWIALGTLTALEIVLGIDNIIFISILAGTLPRAQQARARVLGLALAMVTRVLLLLSLSWMMRLTEPFVTVLGRSMSGRDLILIGGGLFLLGKSTVEIHEKLEAAERRPIVRIAPSLARVVLQIAMLDIVFSLDSVITAVGMVDRIEIMILAILLAMLVMMIAVGAVSRFIERHPTVKMLALSFLLLIGMVLVAEGFDLHVPKGYIYFAMAFSAGVEMLNIKLRERRNRPAVRRSR